MLETPLAPLPQTSDVASSGPASRPPKSRHAVALDAIVKDKPCAVDAAREYLETLAQSFDEFALEEPANGLLDTKVLAAIDKFRPYLDEYRQFIATLAEHPDVPAMMAPVAAFLDGILARKKPAGKSSDECFLWADAYRFILRELFLTTVSIFVHGRKFDKAVLLLDYRYHPVSEAADQDASFVVFDAYVKTLDEFRNRRLQLNRMSVCSDLMRERADESLCPFALMMQVDFVLCLRSLLHEQEFFERWYPRTLVFAERFAQSGLDMFVTATESTRFAGLSQLLRVADRAEMVRKFEDVYDAWNLERWELARVPLDFRGYMAMNNQALSG